MLELLIFLYTVLTFPEFYYEKTKFLAFASIGVALLNVVLNYIYVNKYGVVAAGYTTLFCYIIYSIGHYIVGKRVLNRNIPKASMIDESFVLIISIGIIAACILGSLLIPYRLMRYILIGVVLAILIMKREQVLIIFSDMKKRK